MPYKIRTHKPAGSTPSGRAPDNRISACKRGYGRWWNERTRKAALSRDHFICQHCGKPNLNGKDAQVDHIVSRRNGGTNELSNLQTLCASCHSKKTYKEDGGLTHV